MEVADDDGGRRKDGNVVGQVPAGFVTGVGQGSMEIEARTEKEFFKIERKKAHPVYKDNFIKYELYEYTEDDVENFKKETLNKEFK